MSTGLPWTRSIRACGASPASSSTPVSSRYWRRALVPQVSYSWAGGSVSSLGTWRWAERIRWSAWGAIRDAARVIEREAAVRAVEGQLERDYQQWRAVSVDAMRMAVVRVEEHELVWIVSWQSEEFVRTRNSKYMLIGNGPYLVDRVDGGLHQIGVVSAKTGEWEIDYRVRIRGLPVRTAVDDLHDALCGVAATHGRMHAVRTLRQRLPMLSLRRPSST
ncbi:YrhB domain-containing protein [Streptomyces kaempferi]